MLTLEYLTIFALSLILIGFSVSSLLEIEEMSKVLIAKQQFKLDSTNLKNTISEVCILGDGNSREIFLKTELFVSQLSIKNNDNNLDFDIPCEIEDASVKGNVIIKNEGKIIFN